VIENLAAHLTSPLSADQEWALVATLWGAETRVNAVDLRVDGLSILG
jgi:hypothetical protein